MRVFRAVALVSSVTALAVQKGTTSSQATGSTATGHSKKQAPGAGDRISGATDRVAALVQLIEQLKQDFIKEFEEARSAYDKQSCAHEDTIKMAKKTMAAAITSIKDLSAKIDKNSADIGALTATVQAIEGDIAAKKADIAKSIKERKSEHSEYSATVKEFNDAIRSAQLAYEVLTTAKDASLKTTQAFLTLKNKRGQRELFLSLKGVLRKLPLNSKIMTVDKIEALTEYVDDTLEKIDSNVSSPNTENLSLVQFGPASQRITGILKDMRGQYVAKLQGAQLSEQEAASAHVSFLTRARALLQAMVDSKQARQADLDAATAAKEANTAERDAKEKEKTEMDQLSRETTAALQELAKAWGVTSQSHNDEQNGIAKALDYLAKQQKIKAGSVAGSVAGLVQKHKGVALLQMNVAKKPLYDNMFQKIAWAIEDMVKTHTTDLADNKARREVCNTMQSEANSAAAGKKAAIEALERKISELDATITTNKGEIKKMDGERTDLNTEIDAGNTAWMKSDKSREVEITQLQETVPLIAGAIDALGSSGSDRMGDVIAILEMLKNESITSIDALGKSRTEEAKEWSEQKTTMDDMVLSLTADINGLEERNVSLEKTKGETNSKLTKTKAVEPMDMNECKSFLMTYQAGQDALNQKIQDLTSAKAHLTGWKNMSTDAEHFDSTKTDYVAPP